MYLSVDPKASCFRLALGAYAPVYFFEHLINQLLLSGFRPAPFIAIEDIPAFFTLTVHLYR